MLGSISGWVTKIPHVLLRGGKDIDEEREKEKKNIIQPKSLEYRAIFTDKNFRHFIHCRTADWPLKIYSSFCSARNERMY